MDIVAHNHSGYPFPADTPTGKKTATRADIDAVIDEQQATGTDVVTGEPLGEADPISRVMTALDGVRGGSARRCADHDALCRQWVVEAALRRRRPIVLDDFLAGKHGGSPRLKPVLTGPYTLARHCRVTGGAYGSLEHLGRDLSAVLAEEVAALVAAGARWVQVEEPSILEHGDDVRLLRELLEPLWAVRGDAQLVVATYFGDSVSLYAQLHSLPVDVVAVDVASNPALIDLIGETGAAQRLAIGIVDGRNAALENADELAAPVQRMLRHYTHDSVSLMPSCSLHRLPRGVARRKLEELVRLRSLLAVSP
jgi:5-methyltetrahydropteroyltriglutamate--homocysteine methyltransferase